jgi:hypothetical protein
MKKISVKKIVAGVAMTTLVAGLATGAYAGVSKSSCGKGSCGKSSCGSKGAKMEQAGKAGDEHCKEMPGKRKLGAGNEIGCKGKSSCGKGSCGS